MDINILSANIEEIGDQRIGQLQAELVGEQIDAGLSYLHDLGVHVKLHQEVYL